MMIHLTLLFAASLVPMSPGLASQNLTSQNLTSQNRPDPLRTLESKLHGVWKGLGPCDGDLILRADGTYERKHFSPGNNSLSGTWKVRWDALPPTLILVCETSDRTFFIGRTKEVKLVQLNETRLQYQYPKQTEAHYTKVKE